MPIKSVQGQKVKNSQIKNKEFLFHKDCSSYNMQLWAAAVSQLVERSLLTPEIHGSNPVIGNFKHY